MRAKIVTTGLMTVAVLLVLGGCDALPAGDEAGIKASGVVEVMEVSISAEIGGRVAEVLIEEGAVITVDQTLFRLDDADLQIQRQQIEASGKASVKGAELALLGARIALSDLEGNWPLTAAEYQLSLAQARDALLKAENRSIWSQKNNRATDETIEYYEAQLVLAEKQASDARTLFNHYKDKPEQDRQRAEARVALELAEDQVDQLVSILNWYGGEPTDIDQAILDANVALARAQVDEAQKEFEKWRSGPDPDLLALARAAVANAEAQLELAGIQARSQLQAIDLMLQDAVIRAPVDGVILAQSVEPGEVILPGVPVVTIGNLERMTITVYLAENQYGKVRVGDLASVSVDSFPAETFEAQVTRIADEAEYTPRNVQTAEERQTTVYAVELRVNDPVGKLKPGMPADVLFETGSSN